MGLSGKQWSQAGHGWCCLHIRELSDHPIPLLPFTLLFVPITLEMGIILYLTGITEKNVLSYSIRKKLDEEN